MSQYDNTEKRKRFLAPTEFGKVPPQVLDIEESLLGAVLLERGALTISVGILPSEAFYRDNHRIIFQACKDMFNRGDQVDLLTIIEELKKMGELDAVGGPYAITQLTNRIGSTENVEYWCRIILQKYIGREVIRVSSEAVRDAYDETKDVFELLDQANLDLLKVGGIIESGEMTHVSDVATKNLEIILNSNNDTGIVGISSGYADIDKIVHGFQAPDLITIAARPGMGKTAMVMSLVNHIGVKQNIALGVFSLEMSDMQLVNRLVLQLSEISSNRIKYGLTPPEEDKIKEATELIKKSKIYIDDTASLSISALRSKAIRMKMMYKIEILFVDYIQLMKGSGQRGQNREQEISDISGGLKGLAKDLDVPIIALSQLSRAVETRGGDKRPILSDLRESGSIEQNSDIVAFLYRPAYYKVKEDGDGNDVSDLLEFDISKHRNGETRVVELRWNAKIMRVESRTLFSEEDNGSNNLLPLGDESDTPF